MTEQTAPTLERDETALEELDFAPRCEIRSVQCDAPAEWVMRCRVCPQLVLLCPAHLDAVVGTYEASPLLTVVMCGGCRSATLAHAWRDLFEVLPVGGA